MTYSAEIAGAVDAFLKAEGLFYSFDEERGMFRFGMQYDGRMQKMDIAVRIRDDYFIVYAIPPLTANGCLPEMAEFIARVNYGLQNGCFEMDYEDGENFGEDLSLFFLLSIKSIKRWYYKHFDVLSSFFARSDFLKYQRKRVKNV